MNIDLTNYETELRVLKALDGVSVDKAINALDTAKEVLKEYSNKTEVKIPQDNWKGLLETHLWK